MTRDQRPVSEDELHAYVDGWLDPARAEAVEAYLAQHSEAAARIAAYRRQNEGLRAALADPDEEALRERFRPALAGAPRRRPAPTLRAAAAALLVLGVGLGGGWWLRGQLSPPDSDGNSIARLAAAAHRIYSVEVRHPVEVRAEEEHLMRWLSKRVGAPLSAPDLGRYGFRLVGGRLLPAAKGLAAAQLMYEDGAGRRITCYVTANRAGRETAFRFVEDGGLSAFYWLEGRLGYAVVGEVDRAELLDVTRTVYQQLGL